MEFLIIAAVIFAVLGLYLLWTAGRLDRRHARLAASRAMVDAEFLRRSGSILDIASAGLLDPATSVLLADAATRARTASDVEREHAESDLTAVLEATFGDPDEVEELREDPVVVASLSDVAKSCRRAAHARRFHNDMVRSAVRLRRKLLVRLLRLAGTAPMPETIELDDSIPSTLEQLPADTNKNVR